MSANVKAIKKNNEKRQEIWKHCSEMPDEYKQLWPANKERPRDDTYNKALTTVKDIPAEFSNQVTNHQNPVINESKEENTALHKLLLLVTEPQVKA